MDIGNAIETVILVVGSAWLFLYGLGILVAPRKFVHPVPVIRKWPRLGQILFGALLMQIPIFQLVLKYVFPRLSR